MMRLCSGGRARAAVAAAIFLGILAASPATAAVPLVQRARLQPADLSPGDGFGQGVVLSADGRTALVPAIFQSCAAGIRCGAVYVFALENGGWVQQAKLTEPGGGVANDVFGSVALSADGNLALIGTFSRDCDLGIDCGAAYLFERTGGVWGPGTQLPSPLPQAGAYYGLSVGLSGDGTEAVVGAISQLCPSPPGYSNCGAAFVFRKTGGGWTPEATLRGDFFPSNFFGSAINLSRDGATLLVQGDVYAGAGTADTYIFQRAGGTWNLETKIVPPGPYFTSFPVELSGDGQTALIATQPEGFPQPLPLTLVPYVHGAGTWTPQPALPLPPGGPSTAAGLSFDGDTAAVGLTAGGKAQLFMRTGGVWTLAQDLIPTEPGAASSSSSATISDDARTALIGLPDAGNGVVFVFGPEGFSPDVPTLDGAGLALLTLLLAGAGALALRRRTA